MSSSIVEVISVSLLHFVWQGALIGALTAFALRWLQDGRETVNAPNVGQSSKDANSSLLAGSRANVRYLVACGGLAAMTLAPLLTVASIRSSADGSAVRDSANDATSSGNAHPSLDGSEAASPVDTKIVLSDRNESDSTPVPEQDLVELLTRQESDLRSQRVADLETSGRVAESDTSSVNSTVEPVAPFINAETARSGLKWVFGLWTVGVALLSGWHLAGWWISWRRCRLSSAVSDDVQRSFDRLARRLRVSSKVRLRQMASAAAPFVIGWLRPIVLIPATVVSGLSPAQLEAILAHELAHVRRHDYLVNLLQIVVETLLFYHPAVWWLSRRIRIEREFCADDLAIRLCEGRESYAKSLVSLVELTSRPAAHAVAATGGRLVDRVRRILQVAPVRQPANRSPGSAFVGVMATVLLLAGLATLSAQPPGQDETPAATQTKPRTADPQKDHPAPDLVPDGDSTTHPDDDAVKTEAIAEPWMTLAWQRTDKYVPPNYDGFFPDDAKAGAALDAIYESRDTRKLTDDELIEAFRKGLRQSAQHRLTLYRWFGNKYVWGAEAQHPRAIEVMYHATGAPDHSSVHDAIYFGLSVTKDKTANLIHAQVDAYPKLPDDGRWRIRWGLRTDAGKQTAADFVAEKLRSEDKPTEAEKLAYADLYTELTGKQPPNAEAMADVGRFMILPLRSPKFRPKTLDELTTRIESLLTKSDDYTELLPYFDHGKPAVILSVSGISNRDRCVKTLEASDEFTKAQTRRLGDEWTGDLGEMKKVFGPGDAESYRAARKSEPPDPSSNAITF